MAAVERISDNRKSLMVEFCAYVCCWYWLHLVAAVFSADRIAIADITHHPPSLVAWEQATNSDRSLLITVS